MEYLKLIFVIMFLSANLSAISYSNKQSSLSLEKYMGKLPNDIFSGKYSSKELSNICAEIQEKIEGGADPNTSFCNQFAPIHLAAAAGDVAFLRFLLEQKADKHARNISGENFMQVAQRFYNYSIIRGAYNEWTRSQKLEEYLGNLPLDILSKTSEPEKLDEICRALQLKIEEGASANVSPRDNFAPIHFAAAAGKVAFLRFLLNRGADENALLKSSGENFLEVAKRFGKYREIYKAHTDWNWQKILDEDKKIH